MLPSDEANVYAGQINLLIEIAKVIYSNAPEPDISGLMENTTDILDASIKVKSYIVRKIVDEGSRYILPERIDLSQIDYDLLAADFVASERQHIEFDQLRGRVASKLQHMLRRNKSRSNFKEEFQKIVDEYNQGSANLELTYYKLLQFTKSLQSEEQRATEEHLSEEELAIYDILTEPTIPLTDEAKEQVRSVVHSLLRRLKEEITLDWRAKQEVRSAISVAIRDNLDNLPAVYTPELRQLKRDELEKHVFNTHDGENDALYSDEP
jgi:type I restriction enzyme, R subunit